MVTKGAIGMDKKIQGRSCENCKYRYEYETLIGTIHKCFVHDEEIKLNGYCEFFKEKK